MTSRRFPPWMLLAVVCVGQFMVVLDVSIVNVALPAMRRDLHFSTSALQWVVNAYALSFGGFLLLGGRAGDLFGRRRMFLVGLGLFSAASLVCAMAPNQPLLVAARALQGLGGAVLSPATLTLLTTSYTEPHERSRALGVWSAMAAAGGASGALLGGVLTDLLSWRWIFLINVPVGLATIVLARAVISESRLERAPRSLDLAGALTVTGGLVALVYAVAGTDTHPWGSAPTLTWLAVAVGLLAAFAVVETRPNRPQLVPFRLFRSRWVTGANLAMMLVGGAMFSMWLFLSLYLQGVLGMSPLIAGLAFVPQTLGIIAGAQISSRLVGRLGPRLPLVTGAVLAVVGLAALSRIGAGDNYFTVVFWAGTLATFGMGLTMTPLAFSATTGVEPREAGLASGVLNSSRQIGGSLALAVLATLAVDRSHAVAAHASAAVAATAGYARAFELAAVVAAAGTLCAWLVLPGRGATATGRVGSDAQGVEGAPGDGRPAALPGTVGELALEPEG